MPNLDVRMTMDVIAQLCGGEGDEPQIPGAVAVVRLVKDKTMDYGDVDNCGSVIISTLIGQTDRSLREAIDAARQEVARLKKCTSDACMKNSNPSAIAFGCKTSGIDDVFYAVVAFIPQEGYGGNKIRQYLDRGDHVTWLSHGADGSTIKL